MGDPELYNDESIILKTPDVFVKSIPFDAILTNKRIILVDRKKDLIPPKDILLATIRDVEPSENAIRDQIITLSIITNTGGTRQVVLTFSRQAGGGRKRERDQWAKVLRGLTSSPLQNAIRRVIPEFNQEQKSTQQDSTPPPRIEITSRPGVKKEIEGAYPIKKIIETTYAPPKPIETTSLPNGFFCTRCGNRVPLESVFSNRCGSKITPPGQEPAAEPSVPQVPAESPVSAIPATPDVTAIAVERKERPIEKEIRSIEPLIEGSVPRTVEAPPIPSSKTAEPAAAESSLAQTAQSVIDAAATTLPEEASSASPQDATTGAAKQPAGQKRSIFPQIFLRKDLPQQPAPATIPPISPPPTGSPAPGSRRKLFAALAIIIVIIAVIGGAFVVLKTQQGKSGTDTSPGTTTTTDIPSVTFTPTPPPTTAVPTTAVTTIMVPTTPPQPLIPQTGVWVKVSYPGAWTGSYGTPGNQAQVASTGDQLYQIPIGDGTVQVTFQKSDGSGNTLEVEIYKDGVLITSKKTSVPKGSIDLLAELKPPATPTIKPTQTQGAVNTTATPTIKPTTFPTGNVTTVQTTTTHS